MLKNFKSFFGKFDTIPNDIGQNRIVYCNNPEGEDFVGVFNKEEFDIPKLELLASGPLFWYRKVNLTTKSAKLEVLPNLTDCKDIMIMNKIMFAQNLTFAKFIYKRFDLSSEEDEGLKTFNYIKSVCRNYPKGWRLHVFVRIYFTLMLNSSDEMPWK